jgi:hypothetical protein
MYFKLLQAPPIGSDDYRVKLDESTYHGRRKYTIKVDLKSGTFDRKRPMQTKYWPLIEINDSSLDFGFDLEKVNEMETIDTFYATNPRQKK